MSTYKNFVRDFPVRCLELLDSFDATRKPEYQVTLLLSLVGQAVIGPLERLGITGNVEAQLTGESRRYLAARTRLLKLCNSYCGESCFFYDSLNRFGEKAWRYMEGASETVDRESIPDNKTRSIKYLKCKEVLQILRNAFAHGQIRTEGNPIDRLVFLSRNYLTHEIERVDCTPTVLRSFFRAWVGEIEALDFGWTPEGET